MIDAIIQFFINHLSELISGTIGGIVGSGITISCNKYIYRNQISLDNKQGKNSRNVQIGGDYNKGK